MDDVDQLIGAGRDLPRENPKLTEAGFRHLMLERFRANDQGLQADKRNMGSGSADPVDRIFSVLALPWTFFRWPGWHGRLARHGLKWTRPSESFAMRDTWGLEQVP